ncbi:MULTISPECIES: cell division protein SepF [Arthrobacter]|uniref:Cell division protein SepF n=2 Tax=Arthrobacter TaxID=1663 RepID=A0ABU9KHF0_9MICC|nr:cell division protein SepF [Arthrobacter sp. YJM1]MDP5226196.1 cell division protein SepF [Arthrobacter sp. YJM1]
MASFMQKTMLYLGLTDADEHLDADHAKAPARPVEAVQHHEEPEEREVSPFEERQVQKTQAVREEPAETEYRAPVTPIKRIAPVRDEPAALRQITTIHPRSYNDAKVIGESFRDGIPVIMNVTDMGEADAKRLVDFSAGLVFGLHGSIERVTSKVFLLSPSFVEVLGEEKKKGETQASFFNQS